MNSATRKLYYENNKASVLKKQTEYRESHNEKIKEANRKYYEENAEQMKQQRMKRYFEYEKTKQQEQITCGCGQSITRGSLRRHKTRQRHQNWLKNEATLEEYMEERGKDDGFLVKAANMLNY